MTISKLFPKYGYFTGVIEAYDVSTKLFTVRYVDDDEEDLRCVMIKRTALIIMKDKTHSVIYDGAYDAYGDCDY